MTAQAIAPTLPPDPAAAPPPAAENVGGSHFLTVFGARGLGNAQSPRTAANNGLAASVTAPVRGLALRKVSEADAHGNGGAESATAAASTGSDTVPNVIALPLPLLAQLQPLTPATPADGKTQVATLLPAGSASRPPAVARGAALLAPDVGNAVPLASSSPGALAAAISRTAPALLPTGAAATPTPAPASKPFGQTAGPSLPSPTPLLPQAANSSPSQGVAVTVATAVSEPQQSNPSLTSTIPARLANGAAALVSQPRIALASLAPAGDKVAAKALPSDAVSPNNTRQLAAAQSVHDAAEAPAATAAHSGEPSSVPAKDHAAAPALPLEVQEPAAREPTPPLPDNASALSAPSAPPAAPVATSAPAPSETSAVLQIIPHAVAEQVAINVHQAVKSGTDHIQIQLQPADLGTIDVKLNVNHDGRVTVVVSADRSDTLNLLQQDAGGLTQALRDAGLQADNNSLSFNLRGGHHFQQQQSTGSGASARDAFYPSDGGDLIAAPTPSLRRHSGALDIHV